MSKVCDTCGEVENIVSMGDGEYYCNECNTMFNDNEEHYLEMTPEQYLEDGYKLDDISIPDNLRELCYCYKNANKNTDDLQKIDIVSMCNLLIAIANKDEILKIIDQMADVVKYDFINTLLSFECGEKI